jgi:CDP-diacylglycerol--serine O-phosphatidyltransferase
MGFDMLDGRVARYAGATSRFGVEYDSIADTVSFGVAPAVIAFNAGSLQELGWTGWVLAFTFTACAALRLARFNVTPARYIGRFDGLPSPAAAGMVASFTWLITFLRAHGLDPQLPAFLPGLGVALLGVLMVSPIPYRSFKDFHFGRADRSVVPAVLFLALVLSKPSLTFPAFGLGYTLSGPVEWWWRRRTGRALEPFREVDESPEEESS